MVYEEEYEDEKLKRTARYLLEQKKLQKKNRDRNKKKNHDDEDYDE